MRVAEQLTFELATSPLPTFASFVPGYNVEAVAMLHRVAVGQSSDTGTLIWGAATGGKSHLLRATVDAAAGQGRHAAYFASPAESPDEAPAGAALIAVDDIDRADPAAQARLFRLYNALCEARGHLVAAASVPPGRMPLRDDLRSRLGWGLVFEVVPLSDADKPAALEAFASARGVPLGREVVEFLLARGQRDLASLTSAVSALDRISLARHRPITVGLAREWLGEAPAGVPVHDRERTEGSASDRTA